MRGTTEGERQQGSGSRTRKEVSEARPRVERERRQGTARTEEKKTKEKGNREEDKGSNIMEGENEG